MKITILLLGLLQCCIRLAAAETPNQWSGDMSAALTRAAQEQRLVLVKFTGSDWSEWCQRLQKETLGRKHFLEYAQEHLILVEVDFPQEKKLSDQQREKNAEWVKRYAVEAFPTLLLLTPEGKEVGRIGFIEGGPKTLVRTLKQLAAKTPSPASQ